MTTDELYNKVIACNYKTLFEKLGYTYFSKGNYNLNIIGVRSNYTANITNKFDDFIVLDYYANGVHKKQAYLATTKPGAYYMKNPMNSKGCAILVPGQYRGVYSIGKHNGKYDALCQTKPMKVYRDGNLDDNYDIEPETITKGVFGINIHKANSATQSVVVNKWSAGCQVIANPKDFDAFMRICKTAQKTYGNSFTYTLLTIEQLGLC